MNILRRRHLLDYERRRARDERREKWRRVRHRVAMFFAGFLAAILTGPALFVGTQCYPWGSTPAAKPSSSGLGEAYIEPVAVLHGHVYDESLTFLTLPEWFIVYSSEEYATVLGRDRPSRFPYFGSVFQYWAYYGAMCEVTRSDYPFAAGSHVRLSVIGVSFAIETMVKGVYENTMGRVTEWLSSRDTAEDMFATRVAREYGTFLHTMPWYRFPFWPTLTRLWTETPLRGPNMARKLERRLALSAEYGVKAAYGWIIGIATGAAYDPPALKLRALVANTPEAIFEDHRVRRIKQVGPAAFVIELPRDEAFTVVARELLRKGVRFVDIAGNDEILVTAVVPASLEMALPAGRVVTTRVILTAPQTKRVAMRMPVRTLDSLMAWLQTRGMTIEHLYDY